MSSGGFPAQMAALGALFDELTLVIVRGRPMTGGMPLPRHAQVVPLRCPVGDDIRRKVSVAANSIHYLTSITRHVRDRKSTRLNSSHSQISYAVFCLKK